MPAANDPTLTHNPDDPLDELIAEYLVQLETDQAPSRDAFIAAHPEFAEQLREFFAGQDAVRDPNPTASAATPSANHPRIRYVGDFELLEEIARGGMGVVYKARQMSMGRLVALKMMLSGPHATDTEKRRFYGEPRPITSVAFGLFDRQIFSAGSEGTTKIVKFWHLL